MRNVEHIIQAHHKECKLFKFQHVCFVFLTLYIRDLRDDDEWMMNEWIIEEIKTADVSIIRR